MARRRDFLRLRGVVTDMRTAALTPFLAEALRDWESLLDLERANFSVFVSVLLERERRGVREISDLFLSRLAERIQFATATEPLEQWLAVRDLLNRLISRRWVANICTRLDGDPPSHGLKVMAALQENGFNEYLRGVLCKPDGPRRIFDAIKAGAKALSVFLVQNLAEYSIQDEAARKAYRLLLQVGGEEFQGELSDWTNRYTERLTRGDLEVMARSPGGFRPLSKALAVRDRDFQSRMSRMVAEATGRVLIPPGKYSITEDGKLREAVLTCGIVIPCENVQINVPISASPLSALPARLEARQILSYSEALIALQNFRGTSKRSGVLFNPSRQGVSEIFRQDAGGLAFYVIPNVEDRALAAGSKSSEKMRTSYRAVEYLD
jgi:hypothetical protein